MSMPRIDMMEFADEGTNVSCFRPAEQATLVLNNYDMQYKQETITNCLICQRPIYLNAEATVDIYNAYTTTSKNLLADAISNLILTNSPHMAFPTTILCMHCYSMIDRADAVHHEFIEIKTNLRQKMTHILTQEWGHSHGPADNMSIVREQAIEPQQENPQQHPSNVEVAKPMPAMRKLKRYTAVEVCIPGLVFLPSEDQEEYPCLFCFRKFEKKAYLAAHFDRQHGKKARVECKICDKDISGGLKVFMYHMGSKHTLKDVKEGMGELKVKDGNLLNLKKLKKSAYEVMKLRRINCLKCEITLPETEFDDHVNSTHARNRLQNCEFCEIAVPVRKYKTHLLEKHEIGEPHTCPLCPEQFTKKYKLYIHKERVHNIPRGPEKAPAQCPICHKKFTKAYSMKLHMKFIHENQRPNVCHICSAAFQMKGSLTVHLRKHAGIRPYMCEICSKTFDRVTECKKHIRKVHKIQCNRRFNDALHPNTLPIKVIKHDKIEH